MGIANLLAHCTVLSTSVTGNTTLYLVVNRHDPTASNRWVLVDLSHQSRTQANYVSNIQQVMNNWSCHKLLLFVNTVTASVAPNLTADRWWLIDAAAEPVFTAGYECFPLLYQDHDTEQDGLHCWVPALRKMMLQREVYEYVVG